MHSLSVSSSIVSSAVFTINHPILTSDISQQREHSTLIPEYYTLSSYIIPAAVLSVSHWPSGDYHDAPFQVPGLSLYSFIHIITTLNPLQCSKCCVTIQSMVTIYICHWPCMQMVWGYIKTVVPKYHDWIPYLSVTLSVRDEWLPYPITYLFDTYYYTALKCRLLMIQLLCTMTTTATRGDMPFVRFTKHEVVPRWSIWSQWSCLECNHHETKWSKESGCSVAQNYQMRPSSFRFSTPTYLLQVVTWSMLQPNCDLCKWRTNLLLQLLYSKV